MSKRFVIGEFEKFLANLYDKEELVIYIRNLKQAFNHGLFFKKQQGVIELNQNGWLKPCIDIKTYLRKNLNTDFEKGFFEFIDNAFFGKSLQNVRKHRYTKLVTTEARKNHLLSEPNYNTTKFYAKIY